MNRKQLRSRRALDRKCWAMTKRLTRLGYLPDHLTGDVRSLIVTALHKALAKNQITKGEHEFMLKEIPS